MTKVKDERQSSVRYCEWLGAHIVNACSPFSIGDFSEQLFNNYNTDGDVLEVGLSGLILFMPKDFSLTDPTQRKMKYHKLLLFVLYL